MLVVGGCLLDMTDRLDKRITHWRKNVTEWKRKQTLANLVRKAKIAVRNEFSRDVCNGKVLLVVFDG